MSFEIRQNERGLTAYWDGKLLTSAYAPEREAQGWADRVTASPGSLVFVAGDPWGLACRALADRGVRAVALLASQSARVHCSGVEAWAPEDGPLENFLQEVFETTGPDGVLWEVWPAFERLAPDVALDWGRRFRDLYRTVQGSWLTRRRFGPRFWRNAVRNFVDWERAARLVPGTRPIVIAASGPSLDDGVELLRRHRERFDLWALPSSFETLVQRALSPDAGIATDGGYYAREHLHRLAGTEFPLFTALSSAPDRVLAARPCLFFSQGLPIETALLQALGSPFPEVPSQGTVAVTALRLALEATTGPVFIAGLDLCFRGSRGHAYPHTVDRRDAPRRNRFVTADGQEASSLYEQATVFHGGARTSPALLTYASWFRNHAPFARVQRIAPSPLRWDSMAEITWDEAGRHWAASRGTPVRWSEAALAPRARRREAVLAVLGAMKRRMGDRADPWRLEAARTAVPEALAEDFRAARLNQKSSRVAEDLPAFLDELMDEIG